VNIEVGNQEDGIFKNQSNVLTLKFAEEFGGPPTVMSAFARVARNGD
jgi:hypothetical protein